MPPIGHLLWRNLRVYKIFGANTDVGKTIFASILCNASRRIWKDEVTAYLKPVSTGPEDEADDGCLFTLGFLNLEWNTFVLTAKHIRKFAEGVLCQTLYQYDRAVSPHLAAKGNVASDESILKSIHEAASRRASAGLGWLFIETAGGVHSPAPSGTTQADLYAMLRCPVILVGDWRLGGISSTISAFESLKLRGYDVEAVVMFEDEHFRNSEYLREYFMNRYGLVVTALPLPPPRHHGDDSRKDEMTMLTYYTETSEKGGVHNTLALLDDRHSARVKALEDMAPEALKKIWYPFTQQELLERNDVLAIDSAHGNYFQTLAPDSTVMPGSKPLLQPSFDGSASWWTQGLGHGSSSLTLAAAYAAGRYGHVMFAGTIHEPALKLANSLLDGLRNPRLSRVFFSDNGSTGMEVAIKMALRATRGRYGWSSDTKIDILGLVGSYHGDTIGTMNCAEPNIYNEKVEWYEGKGVWLDCPQVLCVSGEWHIRMPKGMGSGPNWSISHLSDLFDVKGRVARAEHEQYERYILSILRKHSEQGRRFGALILEPVVLGAGGMILVDPLFQHTLVQVVRQNPSLFGSKEPPSPSDNNMSWSGLPVVFDEVFTGLYRLGRFAAASFLSVHPDISVHAKLLTGGLIPLCVTLASEPIFKAFASHDKSDALLHGHSYTAHPVGCQVAVESLHQLQSMEQAGSWDWAKSNGWAQPDTDNEPRVSHTDSQQHIWSIWPLSLVEWMSSQTEEVAGVWALGSVLAIHLQALDGSGYRSMAAEGLRKRLLCGRGNGRDVSWNVHSRVLGNVLYIMGSQKITEREVHEIAELLRDALGT